MERGLDMERGLENVLQPPDVQTHTRLCLLFYCPSKRIVIVFIVRYDTTDAELEN